MKPLEWTQLQTELIDRVLAGMADRGWTQADLVRHSGVSQPNVSVLLSGKKRGTLPTWSRLLAAVETVEAA